ncbi:uncharacterized protein LOC127258833 [Andrographis paniculata]|uniref:uncharacterized protein LOC127258833 n=1 Tax=Andrographis paniculata TaxID=175694 RepID=UPI0021E8A69A|nr:uncharacterized protein LOC127258833 [Andrographis paniculata]
MEEQSSISTWQISPLAISWIANNTPALLGGQDGNQHYAIPTGDNGIESAFPHVPHQWMYCQQTSQNYVEFLAERAYPEFQKHTSCKLSTQIESNLGRADPSYLKSTWSEEFNHVLHDYSGSGPELAKRSSTARRNRSREKAYAADRFRRLRISHWLEALQEVVPHAKEGGKAAFLDDVIDHVKYLQYQVKDLCQSRLGGESTSNSFIFIEGHGHYVVQEQMLYGPLEEMMGKLIDVYPSAASELLQSKGLMVLPVAFAEGLLEPVQILDTKRKVHSDLPSFCQVNMVGSSQF